jgi:hypothetical protein
MGAGVSLYSDGSRRARVMLGMGLAALLSGAMLYATDQDSYRGPGWVRETYRDSATSGLIAGGAGLALTGVGIWLLRRAPRAPSVPIVFAARDRGLLGWTGRF